MKNFHNSFNYLHDDYYKQLQEGKIVEFFEDFKQNISSNIISPSQIKEREMNNTLYAKMEMLYKEYSHILWKYNNTKDLKTQSDIGDFFVLQYGIDSNIRDILDFYWKYTKLYTFDITNRQRIKAFEKYMIEKWNELKDQYYTDIEHLSKHAEDLFVRSLAISSIEKNNMKNNFIDVVDYEIISSETTKNKSEEIRENVAEILTSEMKFDYADQKDTSKAQTIEKENFPLAKQSDDVLFGNDFLDETNFRDTKLENTDFDILLGTEIPEFQIETETEKNSTNSKKLQITHLPVLKISANISDVSRNLQEIARTRAHERLREEQSEMGFFKKIWRFFTRTKLQEKYFQEEFDSLKNENIFDENTEHIRENASDRFGRTNKIFENSISQENTFSHPDIDAIAMFFVRGKIDEKMFQEQFLNILEYSEIAEKVADIEIQGTNIIKVLKKERENYEFIDSLSDDLNDISEKLLKKSKNPEFCENLSHLFGMDFFENMPKIAEILSNAENRKKILEERHISVEIHVLTGGKEAFAIDNSENKNSKTYKIGKLLQKHPIISSLLTGFGITASSLAAGPFGNFLSGTLGIGWTNGLRRYSEYTDEHADFERRITNGTEKDAAIYQTLEYYKNKLQTATGTKKWWFQKRLKATEKKLELYQQQWKSYLDSDKKIIEWRIGTTHRHIAPISSLNHKIRAYIDEKEGFLLDNDDQKKYLQKWLIQAIARLDAWNETGHNFLKSNSEEEMEADYNILYENILLGTKKLDITVDDLRKELLYFSAVKKLHDDYDQAKRNFENARKKTALKKWIFHGAIYGSSSILLQWFTHTGFFDKIETITTPDKILSPATPSIEWVRIDENIATELKQALGEAKYAQFLDEIKNASKPETLWQTITEKIFDNTQLWNSAKNEIMTFILNATDVQNGITKPELLIEAGKMWIFDDIANNSSRIDRVIKLLAKWGYGDVDKNWLINTLSHLNTGVISVDSLTPSEQVKVAEALWCYVHRNGIGEGSPMWQVFMDSFSTPGIPAQIEAGKTIEIPANFIEKIGIFGIPTWKNTFLSALKKQKRSKNPDFQKEEKSKKSEKISEENTQKTEDKNSLENNLSEIKNNDEENIYVETKNNNSHIFEDLGGLTEFDKNELCADKKIKDFFKKYPLVVPKYKIKLWRYEYVLSPLIQTRGDYDIILGFVKIWTEYKPRLFYFSQSGGNWRSTPWIYEGWLFSKGEFIGLSYEKWTIVHDDLEEFFRKIQSERIKKHTYFYENFTHDYRENLAGGNIEAPKNTNKSDFSREILWVEHIFDTPEIQKYDGIQRFLTYQSLIDAYNSIDIKNLIHNIIRKDTKRKNHVLLWDYSVYIFHFQKKNSSEIYEIQIASTDDNPDLFWVENIGFVNANINSYALPERQVHGSFLVNKPLEYHSQVPHGMPVDIMNHRYSDIRRSTQENPFIKYFRKFI